MKRLLVFLLAMALTGCAAVAPATPTPVDTPTAQVILQTVVVTVVPTQESTQVPTSTPAPTQTPQIIVVTATGGAAEQNPSPQNPAPTQQAPAAAAPAGNATATLPADAGGNLFTSLTRSDSEFALRCQPGTITFTVSTADLAVTEVDMYYRIEDQLSASISDWKNVGPMVSDKHGNFTMDFSAATVNPDLRSHRAWFDYQFVGLNSGGGVVGRSGKIVKQVIYKIDCGD